MKSLYRLLGVTSVTGLSFFTYDKFKIFTTWIPISEDEVIHAWLRAEMSHPRQQFGEYYKQYSQGLNLALENPCFEDKEQNDNRRFVFDKVRGDYSLWRPIHKDTEWYKTYFIYPSLTTIIYGPFPPSIQYSNNSYAKLNDIILWGHEKQGPFIIIEGNHRWYASKWFMPQIITAYVGLSPIKYPLHSTCGCKFCEE